MEWRSFDLDSSKFIVEKIRFLPGIPAVFSHNWPHCYRNTFSKIIWGLNYNLLFRQNGFTLLKWPKILQFSLQRSITRLRSYAQGLGRSLAKQAQDPGCQSLASEVRRSHAQKMRTGLCSLLRSTYRLWILQCSVLVSFSLLRTWLCTMTKYIVNPANTTMKKMLLPHFTDEWGHLWETRHSQVHTAPKLFEWWCRKLYWDFWLRGMCSFPLHLCPFRYVTFKNK